MNEVNFLKAVYLGKRVEIRDRNMQDMFSRQKVKLYFLLDPAKTWEPMNFSMYKILANV